MYNGAVQAVPAYFGDRGQPLPPKYNPADWVMLVAQSVTDPDLETLGFYEGDTRRMIDPLTATDGTVLEKRNRSSQVSFVVQVGLLLKRDFKGMTRDNLILGYRVGLVTFMSILTGCIFLRVGETDPADSDNIKSHFGAELMVLMVSMIGTALPSLIVFPQERPVFLREYTTNHYSTGAYFVSRLGVEAFLTAIQMFILALISYFMMKFQLGFGWHFLILYSLALASTAIAVMIGSAVTNPGAAIEMLPMVFIPQILFAGFFVQPDLIPVWLRWVQYIMPLTYGVKLHLEQEFNRDCGSPAGNLNCENLLNSINANANDVWWYWVVLLGLFVGFRLTGLFFLKQKAHKFY